MAAKKSPDPIDKHVGSRVRMRRMMLSMSQEELGGSRAVRRAKRDLKVISRKEKKLPGGGWFWELPPKPKSNLRED